MLYWLGHDEWWLSAAAMAPLSKIAGDERYSPRILPAVANVVAGDTHVVRMETAGRLFAGLKTAPPDVQKLAVEVLCNAYKHFPTARDLHGPDKISMEYPVQYLLSLIAAYTAQFPGGLDALYVVARGRNPNQVLPHSELFLEPDTSRLSPGVRQAVRDFKQQMKKTDHK